MVWSPASLQNEASSCSNASLKIHSGHEDADFYRQPNGASLYCGSSSQPYHINQLQPSHMTQQPTTQGPIMLLNNGRHKAQRVHASSEMSSEVAHVLHFLERDLLDDEADETDVAASRSQESNTGSDGNWADTLEELFAVESSPLYS
jgi:hypothetical protein